MGLHYNWNRYYDPKTGRYLTPDQIGVEDGDSLFIYVANNPVNLTDPDGTFIFWIRDAIKCWYYRRKIDAAQEKCRKRYLDRCETLEDEIKLYEEYGATGYAHYIVNCVIQETGDPKIYQKMAWYCFKTTFPPNMPKPPKLPR